MENKMMRFLSLLLAFVMVLGMFPVGHVHAEENGNTINLTVGGNSHTITVNGDVRGNYSNEFVTVDTTFVSETVPTVGNNVTEGHKFNGVYLITSRTRNAGNRLSNVTWTGIHKDGKQLETKANTVDATTMWHIVPVNKEDGTFDGYHVYTVEQNNVKKYLKVDSGVYAVTDETPVLDINWNSSTSAWEIAKNDSTDRLNHNNWGPAATSWGDDNDEGSQWNLVQVVDVPVKTTSGNPVSWDTGLENGAEYLIISANEVLRGLGTKAVTNTLNSSGKLPTKVVDVQNFGNDIIWKLAVDSVAENGSVTGKLESINPSGDKKYLGIAGSVTLVEDGTVTIEHGTSGSFPARQSWGVKITGSNYLNFGTPVGNWNFDNGSHWYFYEVIPAGTTTITFTAMAAGETDITIGGTTYHIVVTDATVDPDPSLPVDPDPSLPEEPETPELPELEVIARYTSNRLSWEPAEGTTYTVQYSTNGEAWTDLGTASGKYIHDTEAVGTQYFYRLAVDGNYSEPVQGDVTGMEALLASATHYKVYENGIAITNGLNANGEKEIFAEGDAVTKLNTLESGTIIYKANNTEYVDNSVQAVLGTDKNHYVGTQGNKFRHDLGARLMGNPDHGVNAAGIDYLAGVVYDRDASHWALASQGTRKALNNIAGYKLLANTGATVYYVGCSTDNGNVSNVFTGTVYSVIVTGEVLTDAELSAVTTYNCGNHAYTTCEDTICNNCGYVRQAETHEYDHDCDAVCNKCLAEREVGEHQYTNEYDPDCNECGAVRQVKTFGSEKLTLTVDSFKESGNNNHESHKGFEYLIDGITGVNGNYWTTDLDPVADCWLEIDLGGKQLVNRFDYTKRYESGQGNNGYNCTGNLINYIIEARVGDGEWEVVVQGNTEVEGTTVIEFAPIEATHLRLRSTESYFHETVKKAISAAEIAVYKAVCNEGEHVPGADATCTTAQTCTVCGKELTPATDHAWGKWTESKAATCKEAGEEKRICTVCGESVFETRATDKLTNHAWGEWTETKAATYNEPGEEKRICTVCGESVFETRAIDMLTGAAAQVGNVKYATLAEAVAVGGEVELLADITLTEHLDVAGNVTLNLNGNTITGEFEDAFGIIYVKKGATLTVTGEGAIVAKNTHAIGNYGNVIVNGGEIVSEADEFAGLYNFYYMAGYYGISTINGGSVSPVFNCGELTVNGGEIAYLDNSGKLVVEGGEIDLIIAKDGTDAADVVGAGTIAIADTANVTVLEGYKLVEIEAGVYKVVAMNYVAESNGEKFESLAEAVAAGGEVVLLANTNGNGIIIDKDVTIDLNNYTYTINGTLVGSTGTKSCGFQILPGNNVVIKNGAIVMGEDAVRGHDNKVGNNFVIQNYANMTLENVTVTGNSFTSYVVSNNSGNVVLTGTTINTVKEGAVAFDVCKYLSYAEPTVTVNGCDINGKIEAAAKIGNVYYATFEKALASGNEITLLAPVVITENTTLDLNGKKLDGNGVYPAIRVQNGATLTIEGGEFVNATDYLFTLGSSDKTQAGNLIINGGSFKAMTTIASVTKGILTVNGGSFVGFNPADNAAEGAGTSFVAEGCCSRETESAWTVVKGHSYDEGSVTTAPTCTEAGVMTYTCVCGHTYTDEIKATGHTYEIVDGKLVCACGEIDTDFTGIYGDYYFENGEMQKAYRLVKYNGDYYFINDYNKIAKSVTLYLQEKWVAEYGLGEGRYEFDAEGKMVRKGTVTGIEGDYYYIDGVQQKAYQMFKIGDDYYFINDYNKIAKNITLYLQEKWVKQYGLEEGLYKFGADGKLVRNSKVTGVDGEYLYIDGILQRKYQLVQIGEVFYFINDYDKVAKDTVLYLQPKWTDEYGLDEGLYWFNAEGVMTDRSGNVITG